MTRSDHVTTETDSVAAELKAMFPVELSEGQLRQLANYITDREHQVWYKAQKDGERAGRIAAIAAIEAWQPVELREAVMYELDNMDRANMTETLDTIMQLIE